MTVRESIRNLSNTGIQNPIGINNNRVFPSTNIDNNVTKAAYKLDISPYGKELLESIKKDEIPLVNSSILSYDEKLNITNKIL